MDLFKTTRMKKLIFILICVIALMAVSSKEDHKTITKQDLIEYSVYCYNDSTIAKKKERTRYRRGEAVMVTTLEYSHREVTLADFIDWYLKKNK